MRWLIIVVVLAACERAESPPPPTPPDPVDAAVDCPRPPDVAKRVAALERWATEQSSTKRSRGPVEAPTALTQAYVDLELAYGFARLGMRDQMTARLRSAATLDVSDPVHAMLVEMYRARIEDAVSCVPATADLSNAIENRYAALDRVARYKVDRLLEATRTLTTRRIDAIGAFSKRQTNPFGVEIEAIRVMPPARRKAALTTLVAKPLAPGQLDGVLDLLTRFAPGDAAPIFNALNLTDLESVESLGDVMKIAASIDEAHARHVADALAVLQSADQYDEVLVRSLSTLKAHPAVLRTIVERASKLPSTRPAIGIATAHLLLGNPAAAQPILDAADSAELTLTSRLAMIRQLAHASRYRPEGLATLARLGKQYEGVTDSFGTNSHYCLSCVHFNSSIIHGIVDDRVW